MRIFSVLLYTSCLLATSCRTAVINKGSNQFTMIVGTYTAGESQGLYTYQFDENSGKSTLLSKATISNPSFTTLSSDEKHLYSVSEGGENSSSVTSFTFDKEEGLLDSICSQKTESASPCYILDGEGWIATANYNGGTITTFPVEENGVIKPLRQQITFGEATDGVSHLHCLLLSPDKKFLFATDLGRDSIYRFAVGTKEEIANGKDILTAIKPSIPVTEGSGPRHLTFAPNGEHTYLINEIGGTVVAYNYCDGNLTEIQSIKSDSVGGNGSADIHISPDGKFLYASNRLKEDGISTFAINQTDGTLTKIAYTNTGIHPRNFCISPNGRYLLVACRDSDAIQVYSRDCCTGILTYMGEDMDIKLDTPVYVQLAN